MFGFSSWKDRVVPSSVGGGWGRGGAGDDQVRGKLNRRLGGDASELMCVPLEGSWPSCARPGRVPRTEQSPLLCESVVPHPLPGPARLISPLPGARRQHVEVLAGGRDSAGLSTGGQPAHGWSALLTDVHLGRALCRASHALPLRLDFPPALQCSLHPPDPWVESGRSSGIPAAKAPWMSLPATHPSGPDQILCSP